MKLSALEVVRACLDALSRDDTPALMGFISPELEIIHAEEPVWSGHYQGRAGLGHFFGRLVRSLLHQLNGESLQLVGLGEHLVALVGAAIAGSQPTDPPTMHVWTVRDGLVARFEAFSELRPRLVIPHQRAARQTGEYLLMA